MEVYLDNAATTKCHHEVAEVVCGAMECSYGNPSSLHTFGIQAEKIVKEAKIKMARILQADAGEIIFTSGGTEANNLALMGSAKARSRRGRHIITTQIEHPSVYEPLLELEKQGYEVTIMGVDSTGSVSAKQLAEAVRPDTILVSVMHVNNEIGTVQPVEEIGRAVKAKNPETIFHVDAIQSFGKYRLIPKKAHIDLMTVSGHKIHGPKGIGFIYIKNKTNMMPLTYGGGQQKGMRPGTENVPGIVGIGQAAQMAYDHLEDNVRKLNQLKDQLTNRISAIGGTTIHGGLSKETGAPHIISAGFENIKAEVLLHALAGQGVYVSSGSACASNHPGISSTLQAIGTPLLDSTLRFSLSGINTCEEIEYAANVLEQQIVFLRKVTKGRQY